MSTDSLSAYETKDAENYVSDESGVLRYVRTLEVPDARVPALEALWAVDTDNKYPGDSADDIYSRCVLRSVVRPHPTKAGKSKVTITYGKPSVSMLLQPGRGIPSIETALVPQRVWWGRKFVSGGSPTTTADGETNQKHMAWRSIALKGRQVYAMPQPVLVIYAAEYASRELTVLNEAIDWYGKTGDISAFPITKSDKAMFFGGGIQRKPDDASVIMLKYMFRIDLIDGWVHQFQELGNIFPFEDFPTDDWQPFTTSSPGTISRGKATFTRVNSYLEWLR